METQYNWKINTLESYPTYEEYENVVFNVHWSCYGTRQVSSSVVVDGVEETVINTYNASNIGVTGVTIQSGSNFIPYDELTEETVIGWVHYEMGDEQKTQIETNVSEAIDRKINPPVIKLPLPWDQDETLI